MNATVKMLCVGTVVSVAFGLMADDPVYITGAEYEVSNETWLVVKSGNGTLVAPFDKKDSNNVSRLVVARGASLKIGVDSPFSSGRPVLYLNGTLDVNGHSFRAYRLFNDPDMDTAADADDLRTVPGRIINSSETPVTLTFESSNPSYFYGSIEECPGTIDITSVGNVDFVVKSPVTTNTISSITATSKGVLRPETMPTIFKFVFQPPADETEFMKLGEIELTYRGKTVRGATVTTVTTSSKSDDASSKNTNLIDGKANTYWTAGTTGGQTVTISITPPGPVDGYRITPHKASNRPTEWDVYVSRGTTGWKSFLVDSQRNFQWYSRRDGTSTTNILFSAGVRLGNVLGTNTAVTLSSSATTPMEVSTIAPMEIKSLSGSGQVRLRHDTVFGPGDVSGFTGEFCHAGNETWRKMGYLTLSARNGEEQQFSIVDGSNLSIVNGGDDLVSVLLDDASAFADRHLFGRLADGEKGALGLVKRGSGERIVETEDAAYTGPTAVHGGTLTVAKRRASYTARYVRISPTETKGGNGSNPWGMTEFELLDANGDKVNWPSGTEVRKPENTDTLTSSIGLPRLIDGDIATRMLMSKYTSGTDKYPPATIDTKTGVTFCSYRWYTPHNRKEDPARTPTKWIIEVSDTGVDGSWVVCDVGEQAWSAEDQADDDARAGDAFADYTGRLRGPFTATGHAKSAGTGLYTLDSAFFGEGSSVAARDTHRKLKSRYFLFKVLETARPDRDQYSYGWELAELSLYKDGARVPWPDGTTISSAGGTVNGNNNSRLTSLVNNIVWEPDGRATAANPNAERTFVTEMPSFVVINAGEELEFDAYAFVSTSSELVYTDRIPKAWTFGIATSNDSNDNFETIDSVGNYTPGVDYVITQAYQRLGPFDVSSKFPILDTYAANSIGDRSPVAIDAGATLKIDADYEQFGPLSGAGTLDLVLNAVGEINACASATFSGSVTGEGTLAVCGDAVQTFDGATLSGVKTLELNGGAIAGTASFGGNDVTVAFNGGATGATLSGIGTLTVTGDVKYAVPDVTGMESYSATLFTATNIPAASQALLAAGAFADASRKWKWGVTVNDTTVTLYGNRRGTTITIR